MQIQGQGHGHGQHSTRSAVVMRLHEQHGTQNCSLLIARAKTILQSFYLIPHSTTLAITEKSRHTSKNQGPKQKLQDLSPLPTGV